MTLAAGIIGGASDKHARNHADFYATPPEATWALLPHLPNRGSVLEPCCGDGAIAKVVQASGRFTKVFASDLHDRGYAPGGVDFRSYDPEVLADYGIAVVTNPPFTLAAEFIEHYCAQTKRPWVALLLKGSFWHAASRADLFVRTAPACVMPLTWRPNMDPSRGKSSLMEFAWTLWAPWRVQECAYKLLHRANGVDND